MCISSCFADSCQCYVHPRLSSMQRSGHLNLRLNWLSAETWWPCSPHMVQEAQGVAVSMVRVLCLT